MDNENRTNNDVNVIDIPPQNDPNNNNDQPNIEYNNENDIDKAIEKEYDCFCCGHKIINSSPRVVLTFIISLIVLIFSFVFIFIRGEIVIFAPIIAGIVGFWLPSPVQSSQSRKDALQTSRLLQNNMHMNRLFAKKYIA